MSAETSGDITRIQDEDILRKMWQDTEDFGKKKEIRSHMYKLREERLRNFYCEPGTDIHKSQSIPGLNEKGLKEGSLNHADSLGDHSFLSLKSKEIRDSESPTKDVAYRVSHKSFANPSWDVVSKTETSEDGKTHSTSRIATTFGREQIKDGIADYAAQCEQSGSVYADGDENNFTKSATYNSKNVLQQSANTKDNNSEAQSFSSSASSSSRTVTQTQSNNVSNFPPLPDHDTSGAVIRKTYTTDVPAEYKSHPHYVEGNTRVTTETRVMPDGTKVTTTKYETKGVSTGSSERYSTKQQKSATTSSSSSTYKSSEQQRFEDHQILNQPHDGNTVITMKVYKLPNHDNQVTNTTSKMQENRHAVDTKSSTVHVSRDYAEDDVRNIKVIRENEYLPRDNIHPNVSHSPQQPTVTTVIQDETVTSRTQTTVKPEENRSQPQPDGDEKVFRTSSQVTDKSRLYTDRPTDQEPFTTKDVNVIVHEKESALKQTQSAPNRTSPQETTIVSHIIPEPQDSVKHETVTEVSSRQQTTYQTDYTSKRISVDVSPTHDAFARSLRAASPDHDQKRGSPTSNSSFRRSATPDKHSVDGKPHTKDRKPSMPIDRSSPSQDKPLTRQPKREETPDKRVSMSENFSSNIQTTSTTQSRNRSQSPTNKQVPDTERRPTSLNVTSTVTAKKTKKITERSPTSPLTPTKDKPQDKQLKRRDTYEERCRQILGIDKTTTEKHPDQDKPKRPTQSPSKDKPETRSTKTTTTTVTVTRKDDKGIQEFPSQVRRSPEKKPSERSEQKTTITTRKDVIGVQEYPPQVRRSPEKKPNDRPDQKTTTTTVTVTKKDGTRIQEYPAQIRRSPDKKPEHNSPLEGIETQSTFVSKQLSEYPAQIRHSPEKMPSKQPHAKQSSPCKTETKQSPERDSHKNRPKISEFPSQSKGPRSKQESPLKEVGRNRSSPEKKSPNQTVNSRETHVTETHYNSKSTVQDRLPSRGQTPDKNVTQLLDYPTQTKTSQPKQKPVTQPDTQHKPVDFYVEQTQPEDVSQIHKYREETHTLIHKDHEPIIPTDELSKTPRINVTTEMIINVKKQQTGPKPAQNLPYPNHINASPETLVPEEIIPIQNYEHTNQDDFYVLQTQNLEAVTNTQKTYDSNTITRQTRRRPKSPDTSTDDTVIIEELHIIRPSKPSKENARPAPSKYSPERYSEEDQPVQVAQKPSPKQVRPLTEKSKNIVEQVVTVTKTDTKQQTSSVKPVRTKTQAKDSPEREHPIDRTPRQPSKKIPDDKHSPVKQIPSQTKKVPELQDSKQTTPIKGKQTPNIPKKIPDNNVTTTKSYKETIQVRRQEPTLTSSPIENNVISKTIPQLEETPTIDEPICTKKIISNLCREDEVRRNQKKDSPQRTINTEFINNERQDTDSIDSQIEKYDRHVQSTDLINETYTDVRHTEETVDDFYRKNTSPNQFPHTTDKITPKPTTRIVEKTTITSTKQGKVNIPSERPSQSVDSPKKPTSTSSPIGLTPTRTNRVYHPQKPQEENVVVSETVKKYHDSTKPAGSTKPLPKKLVTEKIIITKTKSGVKPIKDETTNKDESTKTTVVITQHRAQETPSKTDVTRKTPVKTIPTSKVQEVKNLYAQKQTQANNKVTAKSPICPKTVPDEKKPQKHKVVATVNVSPKTPNVPKTILAPQRSPDYDSEEDETSKHVLTTKSVMINNEIDNNRDIIITLQRSTSSREPTPNRICPQPTSDDENYGTPRYPDEVSEPNEYDRRPFYIHGPKSKLPDDLPIRVDRVEDTDESLLSVTQKVNKFVNEAERLTKTERARHKPDDLKILRNVDSLIAETMPERPKSPRCQNYPLDVTDESYTTVSERVSQFVKTAETIKSPKEPGLEGVPSKYDEQTADKINKFTPQQKPVSLSKLDVTSKQQTEPEAIPQKHYIPKTVAEKSVTSQKTEFEKKIRENGFPSPKDDEPKHILSPAGRLRSTETVRKAKQLFEGNSKNIVNELSSEKPSPTVEDVDKTMQPAGEVPHYMKPLDRKPHDYHVEKQTYTTHITSKVDKEDEEPHYMKPLDRRPQENLSEEHLEKQTHLTHEIVRDLEHEPHYMKPLDRTPHDHLTEENFEKRTHLTHETTVRNVSYSGHEPHYMKPLVRQPHDESLEKQTTKKNIEHFYGTDQNIQSQEKLVMKHPVDAQPHYMKPIDKHVTSYDYQTETTDTSHKVYYEPLEGEPHYMKPLDRSVPYDYQTQTTDTSHKVYHESLEGEPHYMKPLDRSVPYDHQLETKQTYKTHNEPLKGEPHFTKPLDKDSRPHVAQPQSEETLSRQITYTVNTNVSSKGDSHYKTTEHQTYDENSHPREPHDPSLGNIPHYMWPLNRSSRDHSEEHERSPSRSQTDTPDSQTRKVSRGSTPDKHLPSYMKPLDRQVNQSKPNKFGVTLRSPTQKTPATNQPKRGPSIDISELLTKSDFDDIYDLELLDLLLEKAINYEQRRKIRAQIRLVKLSHDVVQTSSKDVVNVHPKQKPEVTHQIVTKEQTHQKQENAFSTQTSKRQTAVECQTVKQVKGVPDKSKKEPTPKSTDDDKPSWVKQRNLKKVSESPSRTTTTTTRTQTITKAVTPTVDAPTDVITSSYGVGPTDENGSPLFGLRALRVQNQAESRKVQGTVIQSHYYSKNGQEPVGEIRVTKYSSDPRDLEGSVENKDGLVSVTTIQKIGSKGTQRKAITDQQTSDMSDEEFRTVTDTSSTQVCRRDSVKEMSKKFIESTETSKTEKQSSYPKAGLILRTSSFKDSSKRGPKTKPSPDQDTVKTVTVTKSVTSTKSGGQVNTFLTNKSKVQGVQDTITRMKNAEQDVQIGDSPEDTEARALLNKFIGSQVILSGMESRSTTQSGGATVRTTTTTTTTRTGSEKPTVITRTFTHPITAEDLSSVWDEETLKLLLERSTEYEERKVIRSRLRDIMAEQEVVPPTKDESSGGRVEDVETSKTVYTEGPVTTNTVTTRVTSQQITKKPLSPFAKFQQLDKQNSLNSPGTPRTPTGSGPLFKFTDPELSRQASTVKERLLQWCQMKTKEYENVQLDNFSSSWSDGLAFCALIHHFLPDAFDYQALTPKERRYNFDLAFRIADEKANIAPLLDVDDMVATRKPDWKCVFTYVQTIYARFKNED